MNRYNYYTTTCLGVTVHKIAATWKSEGSHDVMRVVCIHFYNDKTALREQVYQLF